MRLSEVNSLLEFCQVPDHLRSVILEAFTEAAGVNYSWTQGNEFWNFPNTFDTRSSSIGSIPMANEMFGKFIPDGSGLANASSPSDAPNRDSIAATGPC